MKNNGKNTPDTKGEGKHEHKLPHEIKDDERTINKAAHDEAEKGMEKDAELTAQSPNDDLDEGESARLGEEGENVVI